MTDDDLAAIEQRADAADAMGTPRHDGDFNDGSVYASQDDVRPLLAEVRRLRTAKVWVLMASFGERDEREDLPQAAYVDRAEAEAMAAKLNEIDARTTAAVEAWRRGKRRMERMPPEIVEPFGAEARALGFGLGYVYEVYEIDLVRSP